MISFRHHFSTTEGLDMRFEVYGVLLNEQNEYSLYDELYIFDLDAINVIYPFIRRALRESNAKFNDKFEE